MGAWGHDIYDNDDACDFAADVTSTTSLSRIEAALNAVLDTPDYLEAPAASEGLAAADIIARLRGHFGQIDAYTEKLDAWVRTTKLSPTDALVQKAQRVITRVRTEPSELLELWSEDGDPIAWLATLAALHQRLAQPSSGAPPATKGLLSRLFGR